jgi:hypothetical protein
MKQSLFKTHIKTPKSSSKTPKSSSKTPKSSSKTSNTSKTPKTPIVFSIIIEIINELKNIVRQKGNFVSKNIVYDILSPLSTVESIYIQLIFNTLEHEKKSMIRKDIIGNIIYSLESFKNAESAKSTKPEISQFEINKQKKIDDDARKREERQKKQQCDQNYVSFKTDTTKLIEHIKYIDINHDQKTTRVYQNDVLRNYYESLDIDNTDTDTVFIVAYKRYISNITSNFDTHHNIKGFCNFLKFYKFQTFGEMFTYVDSYMKFLNDLFEIIYNPLIDKIGIFNMPIDDVYEYVTKSNDINNMVDSFMCTKVNIINDSVYIDLFNQSKQTNQNGFTINEYISMCFQHYDCSKQYYDFVSSYTNNCCIVDCCTDRCYDDMSMAEHDRPNFYTYYISQGFEMFAGDGKQYFKTPQDYYDMFDYNPLPSYLKYLEEIHNEYYKYCEIKEKMSEEEEKMIEYDEIGDSMKFSMNNSKKYKRNFTKKPKKVY